MLLLYPFLFNGALLLFWLAQERSWLLLEQLVFSDNFYCWKQLKSGSAKRSKCHCLETIKVDTFAYNHVWCIHLHVPCSRCQINEEELKTTTTRELLIRYVKPNLISFLLLLSNFKFGTWNVCFLFEQLRDFGLKIKFFIWYWKNL